MKKLILTAAAVMMVLASCTKTKVESIDGPKEIAFKKIEGAMTKEPLTLDQMNDGTMGVYAINHATPTTYYFENAKFGYNSTNGVWVGHNNSGDHTPHYWPLNGQALDFVVYAPFMNTTGDTKIDYENKTLEFTIANNSSIPQTDYLYGSEYYDNNDSNEGTGFVNNANSVTVNLIHALAKITVYVNANVDNVFTITGIILNNTEQGGTITVEYNEDDDAIVTSCAPSTPGTQDNDIEMTLINTGKSVTTNLNNVTGTCLVFPGNQTSFTIKYKMEDLGDTELITTLNLQSTWDSGKHYIYNLTLKANEILFDPTVVDWDDDDNIKDKDITQDGDINLQ